MDASRAQLVIVALPTKGDYVRKISSEDEPHLTLLYLGSPGYDAEQIKQIEEYVEYAATLLPQFTLDVERRGLLGDKDADVLFFNKRWTKEITTFRDHLLQHPLISAAYNAADQFEGWTPHLTMGYPETPAKKDPNGLDGEVTYVKFDRVALWTGLSTGPTFELKPYSYDMEVAMSGIKSPSSVMREVEVSLQHYGVKGMKWGVRRSGEDKPPASDDVKAVDSHKQIIKAGTTRALSNKELREVVDRMNLEQQYSTLVAKEGNKIRRGHDKVKKVLALGDTAQKAYNMANSPAGQALRKALIGV